jgi:hypothetical protein
VCLLSVSLLVLLVVSLLPVQAPPATAAAQDPAGLVVVVWPTPSVQVARGDVLTYQVQAKNFNRNAQSNVRVFIPFDGRLIDVIGTAFEEGSDDWVAGVSENAILVVFPQLDGGETRTITIYTRVAPDLPDGTVITAWPSYSWDDSRWEDNPRSTNAAPVLVGATNESSPFVWMSVTPDRGTRETTFSFFSDRFMPGEPVQAAIVPPNGAPYDIELRTDADSLGRVWLDLWGGWLEPGTYELEVRGIYTNLRARARFVVE